jgi:hydroxymethylglutaryl-CoA reductase
MKFLCGFSKLSRDEKINLIAGELDNPSDLIEKAYQHSHPDKEIQNRYEELSENTLTNFYLPFGIAPNFLINNKIVHVPMVTEESSVVAAASSAAKFWFDRGGFHSKVISTIKKGQVHFQWYGEPKKLLEFFKDKIASIHKRLEPLTHKMASRNGGISNISVLHKPEILDGYYQLDVSFETADAMGANFINTCLEKLSQIWVESIKSNLEFSEKERECEIIMSILSNYNPECIVSCRLQTNVDSLEGVFNGMKGSIFAEKFVKAFRIAEMDVSRAVTHNKGILNGVDALIIATGNDFRAVEAGAHAYAARVGQYRSLSTAKIEDDELIINLTLPLSVGTVGGLTKLHPVAEKALEILKKPTVNELMEIAAALGLASNFSAVKALITTGIQKGHMKMHLSNILESFKASEDEKKKAKVWFADKEISYSLVSHYLSLMRKK